jgi:hypothetical protein
MTAYDRLRASALDALAESLPEHGLQPDEQSLVIDTLSGVDFPAFLAFLGTPTWCTTSGTCPTA